MSTAAWLKAALKRGGLIVAANWPVVLIQFVAEATFKLLLAVPLVGGASLAALLVAPGATLPGGDVREVALAIASALRVSPAGFVAFLGSLAVVTIGGAVLLALVKAGTVAVLLDADRVAGPIERPPLRISQFRQAARFSTHAFVSGSRRLAWRFVALGLMLLCVYAISAGLFVAIVLGGFTLADDPALVIGWTALAAVASSVALVWIAIVNQLFVLFQVTLASTDCTLREVVPETFRFLRRSLPDVLAVVSIVWVIMLIGMAAAVIATAGLGLIAFVPFLGLAVVPLQLAAWLVRGLVFQYLSLAALSTLLGLSRTHLAAGTESHRFPMAMTS